MLDCKLSFFLFRPFTTRTENVCRSSVTVQKENNFLCIASKREKKKKKPFDFHVPISRHSDCRFEVLDSRFRVFQCSCKQNWHTHIKMNVIIIPLAGHYRRFLFLFLCVNLFKKKKLFVTTICSLKSINPVFFFFKKHWWWSWFDLVCSFIL